MKIPALMLALVAGTGNHAQASPAPILGQWNVDLASMPIPPEARPKSVTAEFADAGDGFWRTTYVITGRDGSERRMTSRERLDGKAVQIEGDTVEADSVAMSMPAPGVLVMGLGKDGRPGSVRTYTLAVDGRSMTESAVNVGDDGKPFVRTFRWVR